MFSQFFGGYLLNRGLVTKEELAKAIDEKKNTRMRLGVLAINEGLMTAEQVEHVNVTQQTVDKLFGDLAVDLGYIKAEDVDMLLHKQPTDYLLLGQTLVNNGVLTNSDFEAAINDYKAELSISDDDISNEQNNKLATLINGFYHLDTIENAKIYTNYVSLLFKSIIRFIGDDFTPLEASRLKRFSSTCIIRQDICGAYNASVLICSGKDEYSAFAKRFAKDAYVPDPSFDDASAGEFLNVCNGLYVVNESNESGTELTLMPQTFAKDEEVVLEKEAVCIPVQFTFGEIEFIISV
ncbi:MAG: chemotaxis protein CheX [Oscillospiraceae bacterium]